MTFENVTLSLPSDLLGSLQRMALDRAEPVDDLLRGMLDREVMRRCSLRASMDAGEIKVARYQTLLAPEMQRATNWTDLQLRLALYGVELHSGSGGLVLHDLITGEPLCSSAALGFGDQELMRRFGGPLPDGLCTASAA